MWTVRLRGFPEYHKFIEREAWSPRVGVLVFRLHFTIMILFVVKHVYVILLNKVMLLGREIMVVAC